MSDKSAIPVLQPAWQPTADQLVAARERDAAERMLADHDARRAAMGKVKLVAVTDFTVHDDESPLGRVAKMGEEFEVSEFDLQRFHGKGLPRAEQGAGR